MEIQLPEDFNPPTKLVHPRFIARKLKASDTYLDYMAVMSSIEIIKKLEEVFGRIVT